MTYEQFYCGTPFMVRTYEKANLMKQKRENMYLWLQGRYILDALNTSLSSALGSKNSNKPKYPEKPYEIFPKTKEEIEAEQSEARKKMIANLNAWKANWDRQNKNK